MKKFNWDYCYFKIRETYGYSIGEYCEKKLGKSVSYLNYYKCRNLTPPKNTVTFLIKDMNLNENALWQINETEPEKPAVEPIPKTVSKQEIYDKLLELEKKLDDLINKETPLEKLLRAML